MSAKIATALSAASMACALVMIGSPNQSDNIVIRDSKGSPRVVIGQRSDGVWGIEVNGPDGEARVSVGYNDQAGSTFAVFATGTADRGVAITVDEETGNAYLHVGPRFRAESDEASGDAIVLESRGDGLNSVGVYAGPQKPRIVLESQELQSALIIADEEFKPRASFLRRRGKFGWALWDAKGGTKARVADSAAGLEVDLGR